MSFTITGSLPTVWTFAGHLLFVVVDSSDRHLTFAPLWQCPPRMTSTTTWSTGWWPRRPCTSGSCRCDSPTPTSVGLWCTTRSGPWPLLTASVPATPRQYSHPPSFPDHHTQTYREWKSEKVWETDNDQPRKCTWAHECVFKWICLLHQIFLRLYLADEVYFFSCEFY